MTDSVSVRRPSINDPTKLGSPQQISQTTVYGEVYYAVFDSYGRCREPY